jgi:hypothetical protein
MKTMSSIAIGVFALMLWKSAVIGGNVAVTVQNAAELHGAVREAKPGAVILLAPGTYQSVWIEGVSGAPDKPITIAAADEQRPPVFSSGKEVIHFSACNYITLRHVHVAGCTANGINADDGGNVTTPSLGMIFEHIIIEDIGPWGNHDGLKLSGLHEFTVKNCTITGWGGSAIDVVGCQDGVIEESRFIGKEGFSQHSGVQAKGGSERVVIRRNFFQDAGQRAVNIGGSTGLEFFRPALRDFEARDIEVAGNYFIGSMAPVAFVTAVDCRVRQNTIIHPDKWIVRILQEQPGDKFLPCQRGVFDSNLIVFDRRVQVFVNVGPNTKPETFTFRGNAWFCSDGDRRPALLVEEIGGVYQVDPLLDVSGAPDIKVGSRDPRLKDIGAHAFKE